MPRTQSLAFAIRTRRAFASPRIPQRPSFTTPTRSYNTTRSFSSILKNRPSSPLLRRILNSSHRRPISSTRTTRWKNTLKWQLRFHAYFWPSLILAGVVYTGVTQMSIEHKYPTPEEWSLWTRWASRTARYTEFDDEARRERVLVDWGRAGWWYMDLVGRLEAEIEKKRSGEERLWVDGVGEVGVDIADKSAAWKRGYFEGLIGCARVAENMDGFCVRREEFEKSGCMGRLVPRECVWSEDNQRPKPLPWDKKGDYKKGLSEGDVVDAFEQPEVFYMRVLTTQGFSNKQRLEAALAYADWCEFKGLVETSERMYDWALDIAAGGLPEGSDNVVDMMTGVINSGKEDFVSENLLKACTALGVHHARNGNVKTALPVFLSVLRARKALPPPPAGYEKAEIQKREREENRNRGPMGFLLSIVDFFSEVPQPKQLATGDQRPFHSLQEACEEVGLMTYIGEILFATSETERAKGLSWTRDSVEAAEAVLWFMDEQGDNKSQPGRQKCIECLETGLTNWQLMAQQMAKLARKKQQEAVEWKGTFGLGFGRQRRLDEADAQVKKWDEEEMQIELRKQKTVSLTNPVKAEGGGGLFV